MIGFLLYETVDIVYTLSKLGYNSLHSLYSWYFKDTKDDSPKLTTIEMIQKIEALENRIQELEKAE